MVAIWMGHDWVVFVLKRGLKEGQALHDTLRIFRSQVVTLSGHLCSMCWASCVCFSNCLCGLSQFLQQSILPCTVWGCLPFAKETTPKNTTSDFWFDATGVDLSAFENDRGLKAWRCECVRSVARYSGSARFLCPWPTSLHRRVRRIYVFLADVPP